MEKHLLQSMLEIAPALTEQTDYAQILKIVTGKASVLFNSQVTLIQMVNPATQNTIKTISREGNNNLNNKYRQLHTFLTGWVIENNQGFYSENFREDNRINKELFRNIKSGSLICVPLRFMALVMGTLLLINEGKDNFFTEEDFRQVENYGSIVSPFLLNTQNLQKFFPPFLPEDSLLKKYQSHGLYGKSERFLNLLKSIEAAAGSDVRVLLEGKSGTGKELVARAIHKGSSRSRGKFIAIDCGAIPRELIESELFGHVKGAFTGAGASRKGLLEEANGGTLFMDEINNLPLDIQARFLRVLQEREVRPVGSNFTRKINIRIIAATSTPLINLIQKGEFREDLFYRLYVFPIEIPSLKDREKDIPYLANHFLKKFSSDQNKKIEAFAPNLINKFKKYNWKGNIRELENTIERMVTLASPGEEILNGLLPGEKNIIDHTQPESEKSQVGLDGSLNEAMTEYEKELILSALEQSDWNQSKAARQLGVSEHTVRYKMQKLGIKNKN